MSGRTRPRRSLRSDPSGGRDHELEALRHELADERRRTERDLAFARRVQLNLMPTEPPAPSGWQIAAVYRAARMIGGDFYDVYDLPSVAGTTGLVLADVTGKGMPAALMMAFTRAVLRSAAYNGTGPADALARTNRVLVEDARTGHFVTAIAAWLDTGTGSLRYANAGHEFPLLRRSGASRFTEVVSNGRLLGCFADAGIEDQELVLGAGDVFVAYSDGVTDAVAPDGSRFGLDRLEASFAAVDEGSAAEVAGSVVSAVDAFAQGVEQADDLTLLVVRRLPEEEVEPTDP